MLQVRVRVKSHIEESESPFTTNRNPHFTSHNPLSPTLTATLLPNPNPDPCDRAWRSGLKPWRPTVSGNGNRSSGRRACWPTLPSNPTNHSTPNPRQGP